MRGLVLIVLALSAVRCVAAPTVTNSVSGVVSVTVATNAPAAKSSIAKAAEDFDLDLINEKLQELRNIRLSRKNAQTVVDIETASVAFDYEKLLELAKSLLEEEKN